MRSATSSRALVTRVIPLRHLACSRGPLQTRRLVHNCMRAAGRSLVRSIRRARESARALEPRGVGSRSCGRADAGPLRRFRVTAPRWAPHPFASMPSFAAGGLASLGLGATFALAGAASADASDPSAPQTAFGADVRVSSAALRDVSRDVADGPLARDAARFVSSRKSPCTSTTTTPSSPSPRSIRAPRGAPTRRSRRRPIPRARPRMPRRPRQAPRDSRRDDPPSRFARGARRRRDPSTLAILAAHPRPPRRLQRDATHRGTRGGRRHARYPRRVRRRRRARRHSWRFALVPGVGHHEPDHQTRHRAQTTRTRGRRRVGG